MVTNADTTSITFQWEPPSPPHGVIIGYEVQYWNTSDDMSSVMTNTTDVGYFTVPGLQPNDNVTFQVSIVVDSYAEFNA